MENQEIYYIEESQTWVCSITGRWKIIAVGGGASGGISNKETPLVPAAGSTTSFGAIVAANGGKSTMAHTKAASSDTSGYGGYNGVSYGGSPATDAANGKGNSGHASPVPITAIGYGAGGGASSGTTSSSKPIPGCAGDIKTNIVTLAEGENIPCTIGKGGETPDASKAASGADGVIILQYLGV
jgi:hypothetical protein